MNIDDYLDIISVKHIDKANVDVKTLLIPLIYNKMLDAVSYMKEESIKINEKTTLYELNTYYFDIIKDITSNTDIIIVIDDKELNIKNLTLPIISLKSKIYIKINNISQNTINISYKGYILNSIPYIEFTKYYNKCKVDNKIGLNFYEGKIIL